MSDDSYKIKLSLWVNAATMAPRAAIVIRDDRTAEERRADKIRWRIKRAAARISMKKSRGWWP